MFKAFFPASVFTIFALCSFIASCVFYAANTKATESVEVNADNARYAPEGNIAVFRAMYLSKPKDGRLSPMH